MALVENSEYYQTRVLRGLFSAANSEQERGRRVKEFVYKLHDEHFTGKNKSVYLIVSRYFHMTHYLISAKDFMDAIKASEDATEATVFEYQQMILNFRFGDVMIDPENRPDGTAAYITDPEFTYAVNRLRTQTQIDLYGAALADSMQILVSGKTVGRKFYRGFRDARQFYAENLSTIERVGGMDLPAGNIQDEAEEMKRDYAAAKHGETTTFKIMTGIREIDSLTGGGAPGEMWFIAGYTGEGKTTECVNITYNAMLNGQNVLFATAETLRSQVRRRLISRHSVHPKFNYPKGLTADALKKGTLTEDEEQILLNVIDDLTSNTDYGMYKIVQIPKKCTTDYFSALLTKYETEFFIHVAVWDEIRLASSGHYRNSRREELNDIITEAKQICVNHQHLDDTTGVLLLAPYQISRGNWQEAVKSGYYTKACLSETSEAEKTADLIWSHLTLPDNPREIKNQILKYRDGDDKVPEFYTDWIADVCLIRSKEIQNTDLLDS